MTQSARSTTLKPLYPRSYMAALLGRGLPARIRQLRRSRGWSQGQLAAVMGTTQARVAVIERQHTTPSLSLRTLLRVAEALETALVVELVPLDQFMADRENERPQDC